MALRLTGGYIKMFEFWFEKNGSCTKLDQTNKMGAEGYKEKKVPIIFGNRM